LTRVGATKRPAYRVIAIDKRRSRDGRALEILGFYDPLTEPATVQLDTARIQAWIGKGAQPSDTVAKLMRQSEREAAAGAETEKPKRPTRATAAKKPSRKAQTKKAAAAAEAEATPAEAKTAEAAAEATPEAEDEALTEATAADAADEPETTEGEAKAEA
jgi:small subunit ribosomal protein S16